MLPTTYADGRRCIEHDGSLPATRDLIGARREDLRDPAKSRAVSAIDG